MTAIDYVKDNFDWEDYINANFDSVKDTTGTEFRVCCPKCGDTKYKCYINPDKGLFLCFKCRFGSGGSDLFDFVSQVEGTTRGKTILKLVNEYRPITPEDVRGSLFDSMTEVESATLSEGIRYIHALPEDSVRLSDSNRSDPELSVFWDYLISRGLTEPEIVSLLQVHVMPQDSYKIFSTQGKLKGDIGRRILWPVYGGSHDLVSWQARSMNSQDPLKYMSAPESDLAKTVWPYVKPASNMVVICEGVLDCVALRRLYPDYFGYATFTKHISVQQMNLLKSWGVTDIIIFWDPSAKKEIVKTAENLSELFTTYVPDCTKWPMEIEDPGDALKHLQGAKFLRKALDNRVKVGTLSYTQWRLYA